MPKDPCQPIRDGVGKSQQKIAEIEAVLPELLDPAKTKKAQELKREKQRLAQLKRELAACEKKQPLS